MKKRKARGDLHRVAPIHDRDVPFSLHAQGVLKREGEGKK